MKLLKVNLLNYIFSDSYRSLVFKVHLLTKTDLVLFANYFRRSLLQNVLCFNFIVLINAKFFWGLIKFFL